MKVNREEVYKLSMSESILKDCLLRSVSFRFDKMADNSWRRTASDITPNVACKLLNQINSCLLKVREHQFEEENERWRKPNHLELIFELRVDTSTYIFTAEFDSDQLDYFRTMSLSQS